MAITFYHMFNSIGSAYFETDEMPPVSVAYEDMSLDGDVYDLDEFRTFVEGDESVIDYGKVFVGPASGVCGRPSSFTRPVYWDGRYIGDARCQYLMADVALMLMRL
jgi:hypothetical protein